MCPLCSCVTVLKAPFRPPIIPPEVLAKRRSKVLKRTHAVAFDSQHNKPRTLRDRELEAGDDGFILNLREHWQLKHPQEANDIIPEILDGHNLFDFFDPDIEERLNELERQESEMEAAGLYEESDWTKDPDADDPKMQEIRKTASKLVSSNATFLLFVF